MSSINSNLDQNASRALVSTSTSSDIEAQGLRVESEEKEEEEEAYFGIWAVGTFQLRNKISKNKCT